MGEQAVEKAGVELVEDLFQVVTLALRPGDMFAAAGLSEQVKIAANVVLVEVEVVAFALFRWDWFAVELADEDVGEGFEDRRGGGFERIGDAEFEPVVVGADEGIGVGEAAEFDGAFGNRCPRTNGAKDLQADFGRGRIVKPWELKLGALDLHVS